jgi:hypothetical protein
MDEAGSGLCPLEDIDISGAELCYFNSSRQMMKFELYLFQSL